jgi:tetratricopeptide (TPR) repeat protein
MKRLLLAMLLLCAFVSTGYTAVSADDVRAEQFYKEGRELATQKNYPEAINSFSKAIALNPKHSLAYVRRGLAYLNSEAYDLAIYDYTKAIELKPDTALFYGFRGDVKGLKRDYEGARQDYEQALAIDPNNKTYKVTLEKLIKVMEQ